MNDNIINELYDIRNYLDQIESFLKKLKSRGITLDSFVQTREHLYEIYNDRLDLSIYQGHYFEGLGEVVKRMKNSVLNDIRLSYIDGDKRSCSIFSSEDYSTILGIIFYDN
ncbi:hypothetical protein OK18_03625 [Chryseobacterium gallinarum]|uniref:Uncharacterized protein n=2 Tax=Chryseobacterium TaxID=59732 RepID=A0A0G3LYY4_CHRGL|nr:hypothetical protein [Chryseobacterium gallinarum]AKK71849.1 hypothetical protein OK18_03625 [Chryseobacterium gallinarum]